MVRIIKMVPINVDVKVGLKTVTDLRRYCSFV